MAKKRYYKKDAWMICPKCDEIISRKGLAIHKSRWCIHKTVIKSPNTIGGQVPFSVMKWYKEEAKKRNINIAELLRIIPTLIKKSVKEAKELLATKDKEEADKVKALQAKFDAEAKAKAKAKKIAAKKAE